ncbi:MAG TPA: hypothetical protein VGN44_15800 [Candidatus Angelobacter sp.]
MNSWFKIVRPDWIVQNAFESVWLQNGGPVGAALFCKRNMRERTNEFYLTPEAANLDPILIARFGGIPCDPPDLSHPTLAGPFLISGDQSIIEGIG